ncbi:MAG: hypothetical protein KAS49_06495, partial [Candidatus Cloacimonetes bacterium]|nr:hypothetical protein [Candidatus Cloacimonadota bacterium]
MKKILIIFFFSVALFLFSDELNLGKFVIEGKSFIVPDSLENYHRLAEYDKFENFEKISFKAPYFQTKFEYPQSENSDDIGVFSYSFGNHLFSKFRSKLVFPKQKLLGIALNADYFQLEKGWNCGNGEIIWQPQLETNFLSSKFFSKQITWDDGYSQTTIDGFALHYQLQDYQISSDLVLNMIELKTEY